jgi:hypothetical protein
MIRVVAKFLSEMVIAGVISTAILAGYNYLTGGNLVRWIGGTVQWTTDKSSTSTRFNPECEYRWIVPHAIPIDGIETQVQSRIYATYVTEEVLVGSAGIRQFWMRYSERGRMHYANTGSPGRVRIADGPANLIDAELQWRCP